MSWIWWHVKDLTFSRKVNVDFGLSLGLPMHKRQNFLSIEPNNTNTRIGPCFSKQHNEWNNVTTYHQFVCMKYPHRSNQHQPSSLLPTTQSTLTTPREYIFVSIKRSTLEKLYSYSFGKVGVTFLSANMSYMGWGKGRCYTSYIWHMFIFIIS